MNNKVKLGWLEYFLELLPSLDSASFKDSTGEGGGTNRHTHTQQILLVYTKFNRSHCIVYSQDMYLCVKSK